MENGGQKIDGQFSTGNPLTQARICFNTVIISS